MAGMALALDGVLVVDKPVGPTSHDVVARVRRATGCRRVGHTGTLDPLASGVLALVMGRATRLSQFISASAKRYQATIRLGIETDTFDAQGTPVPRAHAGGEAARWPSRADVEAALASFRGPIRQTPPAYSAKRVAGVRAYAMARRDEPVALAPVAVEVHELRLLDFTEDGVRIDLTCSAGFYVRSLAHDLGTALGCGAHLAALRRLRAGDFDVGQAVTLEVLEVDPDAPCRHLVALEQLMPSFAAARLGAGGATRVAHGRPVERDDVEAWVAASSDEPGVRPDVPAAGAHVRLLGPDGRLLGVAVAAGDGGWPLRPAVVLV